MSTVKCPKCGSDMVIKYNGNYFYQCKQSFCNGILNMGWRAQQECRKEAIRRAKEAKLNSKQGKQQKTMSRVETRKVAKPQNVSRNSEPGSYPPVINIESWAQSIGWTVETAKQWENELRNTIAASDQDLIQKIPPSELIAFFLPWIFKKTDERECVQNIVLTDRRLACSYKDRERDSQGRLITKNSLVLSRYYRDIAQIQTSKNQMNCVVGIKMKDGTREELKFSDIADQQELDGIKDFVDELNRFLNLAWENSGASKARGESHAAKSDHGEEMGIPKDAKTYERRAKQFLDEGRYDMAIADCGKAIDFDHTYVEAYITRGKSYQRKRKHDLALKDYKTAVSLNPGLEHALKNLYEMNKRN